MSSIASSFVDAAASLIGGLNASYYGKMQQRRLRMAADQANTEAGINAMAIHSDAARQEAAGFVQGADAGGVTGSALNVLNDFAGTSLFNERAMVYRGQTEAANDIWQGNVARANGQNALTQSIFSAGSSILGGMGQQAQQSQDASSSQFAAAMG